MSRYRVELSPRAQADLERITQWWAEDLPSNIEIFDREIAHAFAMLAELPEAGPACNRLDRSGTRRTLLRIDLPQQRGYSASW